MGNRSNHGLLWPRQEMHIGGGYRDCATWEVVGWCLTSKGNVATAKGNAATAEVALEEALIFLFGSLGRVPGELVFRSDYGLVFMLKRYMAMTKAY